MCARVQVGMVYDHTNMWANIQVSSHPWEIVWALNDTRFWRPFFGTQVGFTSSCTLHTQATC